MTRFGLKLPAGTVAVGIFASLGVIILQFLSLKNVIA